jgi:aminomethyltransferase
MALPVHSNPNDGLQRTPLHALHVELGARLVPFAGYEMPLNYRSGILKEHLHSRAAAGLFDVSHMGQFVVRSRTQTLADAARALESLVPADILGLAQGRQRYALLMNSTGGILDDLMIANLGDRFMLVVNASCKNADEAHLRRSLSETCLIEGLQDQALIALQGPLAQTVLSTCADVSTMCFMDVRRVQVFGMDCIVARSGYTGEDGFEISIPAACAEFLAREFLKHPAVAPVGLGARDSLRLEAGLPLYGSDIDAQTTPVEAALEWVIAKSRRRGGLRAGGFPGDEVILPQLALGANRRRVGLRSMERTPIRGGSMLFGDDASQSAIGEVTSGGFGPSVNTPVAMGYVASALSKPGTTMFAEVRAKRVPVEVSKLPFVELKYKKRGIT